METETLKSKSNDFEKGELAVNGETAPFDSNKDNNANLKDTRGSSRLIQTAIRSVAVPKSSKALIETSRLHVENDPVTYSEAVSPRGSTLLHSVRQSSAKRGISAEELNARKRLRQQELELQGLSINQ